jgi:hypothetical protein
VPEQALPAPRSSVLGWLAPVLVVSCLVAVALYLAFRPVAPPQVAARVIRVASTPDPTAAARAQAAEEEARVQAEIALRTSIVGAHQERIDACFARKPKRPEFAGDVALHFDVDASGKVTNVDVLPEDLGKTAFGRCLRAVGKSTRFPASSSEQSFSIPITAGE